MTFQKTFEVQWNDLDANGHMANLAYSRMMTHTRFAYLAHHGLGLSDLKKLEVTPVILRETFHYIKEAFAMDTVTVDLQMRSMSVDKRFGRFQHTVRRTDGERAAVGDIFFVWINTKTRKTVVPPESVTSKFDQIPKHPDFGILTDDELQEFRPPAA